MQTKEGTARKSAADVSPNGEATLYIYWLGRYEIYNQTPFYVNGKILDQSFRGKNHMVKGQQGTWTKVPPEMAVVFEPFNSYYSYPNHIFVIPECKGLEHEMAQIWALGGLDEAVRTSLVSEPERIHLSACETSVQKALPLVDNELQQDNRGPSGEILGVCGLKGEDYGKTTLYYKSEVSACRKDMQDALDTFAGNIQTGFRIAFEVGADKTYYVRLYPYKGFKLIDAAFGAKEIDKAHIPIAP